jgi:predicted molibdopterin-dependent oxidoreductase YjgC
MKITIDGKVCEAEDGQTVLQVAKVNGIHIPTLCDLPELTPTGACRVCMVEVDGAKSLMAACSSPVAEGMNVRTDTERVLAARRFVVDLLLSCHPLDCLTCEKGGDCALQSLAYDLGLSGSGLKGEMHSYPVDTSNPFIIRDYNKCILCHRCVRTCDEIQGIQAIKNSYRGFETKVTTAFDSPLQESTCVFCGQCVQVCPVGALTEKKAVGKGRAYDTKKVRTTCPYCGVGCQLNLHMKGEQIVKVTGVEGASPNKGRTCVKGRFGYDFIYSKDRLTAPLIKEDGKFREASWDEALDLVASKFKQIITESGPDAIAGVSCARSINEDSYQMQKLFRAVIGTNNIDHCART